VSAKTKTLPTASRLLTTGQVASYCDVSTNAVKKWIRNGRLKAFRTPGGHFRIESEQFKEFLVRHNMPIYQDFFGAAQKKVLVVDDDAQVRSTIVEILEAMGRPLEIDQATDGYEALLKAGDTKPDLLILDLRMPRMDGFEACRRIRSNAATSGTRILVVSGFVDEAAQAEIAGAGAHDWMRKPLDVEEFKAKVSRLLGAEETAD
jgi:excisionase family DNA binding protein